MKPVKKTVFLYCWVQRQTRIYHIEAVEGHLERAKELDAEQYPRSPWAGGDCDFDIFVGFVGPSEA